MFPVSSVQAWNPAWKKSEKNNVSDLQKFKVVAYYEPLQKTACCNQYKLLLDIASTVDVKKIKKSDKLDLHCLKSMIN
jgi:hypothetical protein